MELVESGMPEDEMRVDTYHKENERLLVGKGFFHAFARHSDARRNTYMFNGSDKYADVNVCECVIPKGSGFYSSPDGTLLATTKIVVKKPNRDVGRMCVLAKKGTWKTAEKDLGTYTVVHRRNSRFLNLPYSGRNYTVGNVFTADGQPFDCGEPEHLAIETQDGDLTLGYGFFHSAPIAEMCVDYMEKHGMIDNPDTREVIIACTIPKGALYYVGDNGWIASRKIMFWRSMLTHDINMENLIEE
jgi:hypothetical protein